MNAKGKRLSAADFGEKTADRRTYGEMLHLLKLYHISGAGASLCAKI